MTTRSAYETEKYSRIASQAITIFAIVSMFLTGCATRPQVKSSGAFDGQALAAEISVSGPITNDSESQNVSQKVIRKTAMVAQAGYLFVRSAHIDPINRETAGRGEHRGQEPVGHKATDDECDATAACYESNPNGHE